MRFRLVVSLLVTMALACVPASAGRMTLLGAGKVGTNPPIGTPTLLGGVAHPQGAGGTTITFTTSSAIGAGDLAVVAVWFADSALRTVSSISDGTNSYTHGVSTNSGTTGFELWYKSNAAAVSSGATITVSFGAGYTGSGYGGAIGGVVSNASQGIDKTAANTGTSTSISVATGTLTQAIEIVWGLSAQNDSTPTFTESSGFTKLSEQSASGFKGALSYQVVSSTGTVTYAPSWSASALIGQVVATFKN